MHKIEYGLLFISFKNTFDLNESVFFMGCLADQFLVQFLIHFKILSMFIAAEGVN